MASGHGYETGNELLDHLTSFGIKTKLGQSHMEKAFNHHTTC